MGTLTGTYIAGKAQELMVDESGVTYTDAQVLGWINEGQRAVCLVRPDACATLAAVTLTAGTKQEIPVAYRRLMRLICNTNSGGTSHGQATLGPVPLRVWDRYAPGWGAGSAAALVDEYAYSPAHPKTFWVRPPSTGTDAYVLAEMAKNPTDLTQLTDTLDINDVYSPPMIHYVTACLCLRDDERTPNHERGRYHMEQFFGLLQVKTQTDALVAPQNVAEVV